MSAEVVTVGTPPTARGRLRLLHDLTDKGVGTISSGLEAVLCRLPGA